MAAATAHVVDFTPSDGDPAPPSQPAVPPAADETGSVTCQSQVVSAPQTGFARRCFATDLGHRADAARVVTAPAPAWSHAIGRAKVAAANDAPPPGPMPASARIVGYRDDGSAYDGDLLRDILAYRSLRTQALCNLRVPAGDKARFDDLDRLLRHPDRMGTGAPGGLRRFYRFQCDFPTRLSDLDGSSFPVRVLDISAGGIKVQTEFTLVSGDAVAVRFAVDGEPGATTVQMYARVAWARGEHAGLMFAGAPSWE